MSGAAERSEGPVVLGRESPFTLGRLSVDPARRCVMVDGGAEQTIEPRVMQVLVALSRARGGTVTRDEIMRDCWPGMVVGEDSLSRAISRLHGEREGQRSERGRRVAGLEFGVEHGGVLEVAGLIWMNPC